MIIGNGLIANAFSEFKDLDSFVIFASGVSNSKENDPKNFLKELNLLTTIYNDISDKKIIYFSTCSISDKTLLDSKYIQHKINMENVIKNSFNNYTIFRLPNVIGHTNNQNTFFNFMKGKIINNEEIIIQKEAKRYFVDIDDLTCFLSKIIKDHKSNNQTIDICFETEISASEFVLMMGESLNKKPIIKEIDGGGSCIVDTEIFKDYIRSTYPETKNYNEKLIQKYIND